jgi:hypothetical protein
MFVTLKKIIIFFATITIDYITFKYNSYVTNTNYKLQIPGTRGYEGWRSKDLKLIDIQRSEAYHQIPVTLTESS